MNSLFEQIELNTLWFILALLLGTALGIVFIVGLNKLLKKRKSKKDRDKADSKSGVSKLYALADKMDDHFNQSANPKDLLDYPDFIKGVDILCQSDFTYDTLIEYSTGDNVLIACMALEALNRRSDNEDVSEKVVENLGASYLWPVYFALRLLNAKSKKPVIGAALANTQEWWSQNIQIKQFFETFIKKRLEQGEKPTFAKSLDKLSEESLTHINSFVESLKDTGIKPLVDELKHLRDTYINIDYLKSFGRVWDKEDDSGFIFEHELLLEYLKQIEDSLFKEPFRSALLVGEPGVGKRTINRALAQRLQRQGWTIFEAGAAELIAGQKYIGEIEGRVQKLIKNLGKKRRILWFVPNFHELLYAGYHRYNPQGVLDQLFPSIDRGDIKFVGVTQPEAYERIIQERPRLRTALEVIRVLPFNDQDTFKLAQKWAESSQSKKAPQLLDEQTLKEGFHLAAQFLNDKAAPGNLINFLKLTQKQLLIDKGVTPAITVDDLFVILSQLTGLPRSILDDRQGLDLNQLKENFQRNVMGQPEAVDCLVERVAMIKAGLTDPTRPSGVFLFAGPTGTGKTEIAKALSEFLFGSSSRMIRLDMSEFQNSESLSRILGNPEDTADAAALVNLIRKQPFSVVLLDEFEKAHPKIWDIFLQVFDDGRLTDRNGNTADFRHCIIILTSNLGATIHPGISIGFTSGSGFSLSGVEQAIKETFRSEFVNRLDRVVIFRPLNRKVMRDILYKELDDVMLRRGLRNRQWAVEWEDSAIEFLLDKGFTADLGARPLRRAIERYLLSPLAMTIVNHQFPEGDQFLFVRSDGSQINVEFIDPDAPEHDEQIYKQESSKEKYPAAEELRLKTIILDAQGIHEEMEYLKGMFESLHELITCEDWRRRKQEALSQTSSPGFWDSPDRFSLLGTVEYMDRIESGLKTAGSILGRLYGAQPEVRKSFPQHLVRRLAQQLYLLNEACTSLSDQKPREAFLLVEAVSNPNIPAAATKAFAGQLSGMYRNWAKKRRMQYKTLKEIEDGGAKLYCFILAVSGFGAFSILEAETGLHVLEIPKDTNSFQRCKVRVRVAAQPEIPVQGVDTLLGRAEELFAAKNESSMTVVRRYRQKPSPLVRDSVRKWRTGRLDRVFDGDFDMFS